MSKLLIVESPTKARTIGKMLGKDYTIIASMGHIRDLPERELGVDTEHNFAPQYVDTSRSKSVVKELRAAAKTADEIYLAPDPDREGEAIAWHLAEVLEKSTKSPLYRVTFHEITRSAIEKAMTRKGRDQPESRRRAAGAPGPRPHRRLPSQPATLVADRKRFERRARPVGRTAARSRARTGDQRLPARGILGVCAGLPDCGRPGNSRRGSSRSTARISK